VIPRLDKGERIRGDEANREMQFCGVGEETREGIGEGQREEERDLGEVCMN
jgi:hypothetical protein